MSALPPISRKLGMVVARRPSALEVPNDEEGSALELRQSGPLVAVSREWVFRPEAAQQGSDLTR
jgi:hypothetical protein